MADRPLRVLLAALAVLATTTIGVARLQRAAPSTGATARAVTAAEAFLATLDQGQRAKANIDLNEKTRTVWSNLPSGATMQVGATERNGLKLGDMKPDQEKAALALVASTLSRDGFQKAMAIVDADQVLETQSAPSRSATARMRFGRAEFYVAILGKPSATDPWMIQFGGHHLAINVTLAGRAERAGSHAHGHAAGQLQRGWPDDPSARRRERQGVRAHQRARRGAAEAGHPELRGPQPRAGPRRRRQDDRARGRPRLELHAGPAHDARGSRT